MHEDELDADDTHQSRQPAWCAVGLGPSKHGAACYASSCKSHMSCTQATVCVSMYLAFSGVNLCPRFVREMRDASRPDGGVR